MRRYISASVDLLFPFFPLFAVLIAFGIFLLPPYFISFAICADNGQIRTEIADKFCMTSLEYPKLKIHGVFQTNDDYILVRVTRFWRSFYTVAHVSATSYDEDSDQTSVYLRLTKQRFRSYEQAFCRLQRITN